MCWRLSPPVRCNVCLALKNLLQNGELLTLISKATSNIIHPLIRIPSIHYGGDYIVEPHHISVKNSSKRKLEIAAIIQQKNYVKIKFTSSFGRATVGSRREFHWKKKGKKQKWHSCRRIQHNTVRRLLAESGLSGTGIDEDTAGFASEHAVDLVDTNCYPNITPVCPEQHKPRFIKRAPMRVLHCTYCLIRLTKTPTNSATRFSPLAVCRQKAKSDLDAK